MDVNTFLKTCIQVENDDTEVVLYTGNEAMDMDSFACSLAYAYINQLQEKGTTKHIPVVPIGPSQLKYRGEIVYAAKQMGIDLSLCHYIETFPTWTQRKHVSVVLLDHHFPYEQMSKVPIKAIVDHHVVSAYSKQVALVPNTIEMTGSCASLVVKLAPQEVLHQVHETILDLLHSAIIIDTANLQQRSNDTDKASVQTLREAPNKPSAYQDFNLLRKAKFDVGHLSATELLDADFKQWTAPNGSRYGIASIACGYPEFAVKEGWQEACQTKKAKLELQYFVCMFTAGSGGKFLYTLDFDHDTIMAVWGKTLVLIKSKTDANVYHQSNVVATRKQVQPLLDKHLS